MRHEQGEERPMICTYCANWDKHIPIRNKCRERIPWYGVSIYCDCWCETLPEKVIHTLQVVDPEKALQSLVTTF
jgi:hypothetical protein